MQKYIKILTILSKYTDSPYPLFCEHDVLGFIVEEEKISKEDKDELDKLGVFYSEEYCSLIKYV